LGATSSGLLSELMVENVGYTEAYLGCGIIGAIAAVLLWFGIPERAASARESPVPA
jgi:hypothetical protein